jgi:hypothetical protein
MTKLRTFLSYQIDACYELRLEPPYSHNVVITEVAVVNQPALSSCATLRASVETLLMDKPKVDDEFRSREHDVLLASFLSGDTPVQALNLWFTTTDICSLQANVAMLVVNGYMVKNPLKMGAFTDQ